MLGLEFEPIGQQRGRTLEPLARNPSHFRATSFFVFSPRGQPRARFTRCCQRFIGFGKGTVSRVDRLLLGCNHLLGGCQLLAQLGPHHIALLDLGQQAGRFGSHDGAFFVDFFQPLCGCGHALRGLARPSLPIGFVRDLGGVAFARHGQPLVMRSQFGSSSLHGRAGSLMLGPRRFQRRTASIGRGQSVALLRCICSILPGQLGLLCQLIGGDFQLCQTVGEPVLLCLCLIQRAQGLTFGIACPCQIALARHQIGLQCAELGLNLALLRLAALSCIAQSGQLLLQLGQSVGSFQTGRFGCSFATSDKAIPAPQMAIFGHQPLARSKGAAIVGRGIVNQGQSRAQFSGAIGYMIEQAIGDLLRRCTTGPEPSVIAFARRAQRRFGVAAQHRSDGPFIT